MKRQWFLAVLAGLVAGCSGGSDSGVQPVNRAPTITFTTDRAAVVKSVPTTLSVSVSDPDGDPLTVSWTITRGTLTPVNVSRTLMNWTVPATVGIDTINVSVSDGNFTVRITEPIKVGWPSTGAQATFIRSRSPYIVSLDPANPVFGVDEGLVTTVEAGTEILFENQGTSVEVSGRLETFGTAAEPVVFRPNLRNLKCGDERGWWDGILVFRASGAAKAGELVLNHTEIWYAMRGVHMINDATASVRGCAIRCSGEYGVLHLGTGALVLTDTEVSNGKVDGVTVGGNVSTALPDSVRMEHCEVRFNERNGVTINIDDQNEIVPILMEYNQIENNLLHGLVLARASFPIVHFNSFVANGVGSGLSNIYLEDEYPNNVPVNMFSATCNYFALTTQAAIDATIRDSLDNPGVVFTRVVTNPWLAANPVTTPPNCTP